MTSKTFKCVEHEEEVLEVYPFIGKEGGRRFSLLMPHVSSHAGIAFDSTTAPALALAILEAAGWPEEDHNSITHSIMASLGDVIHIQERITAEAEAQAELEAEALELYNVCMTGHSLSSFNGLGGTLRDQWLAVARRAREMAKEATK